MEKFDVIVVGGGIAGASVAAELSPEVSVLLFEQEEHTAYHSSVYGSDRPAIYALAKASGTFFEPPPRSVL